MMKLEILSSPDEIPERGTAFTVSHLLWGTKHAPAVTGSIGYVRGDGFYVEMTCEESDPLRRQEGLHAPVYQDSAMEAFFHFPYAGNRKAKASPYLNLEYNANGALLAQYGYSRTNRTPLSDEACESLALKAIRCDECWTIRFRLPLSLLEKIYGITGFQTGDRFACNFYKISEDPAIEHYAAFSPIQTESPDFHQPEFFACASF